MGSSRGTNTGANGSRSVVESDGKDGWGGPKRCGCETVKEVANK
jgi:hypothetical protein